MAYHPPACRWSRATSCRHVFGRPAIMNVVIIGASGGIGGALVANLLEDEKVRSIHATFHHTKPSIAHPKVSWQPLDLTCESSVREWASDLGELDWLINAAGLLHDVDGGPEKSLRQFQVDFFMKNMSINAAPALLLAKHTQDKFDHGRPAVFASVSARVGSIEDNRIGGCYSYRSSKAALNMCLKTLAIEWRRTLSNVSVAALHPGTTDTALSRPFQRNVPAQKLFDVARTAAYLVDVIRGLTPDKSGEF